MAEILSALPSTVGAFTLPLSTTTPISAIANQLLSNRTGLFPTTAQTVLTSTAAPLSPTIAPSTGVISWTPQTQGVASGLPYEGGYPLAHSVNWATNSHCPVPLSEAGDNFLEENLHFGEVFAFLSPATLNRIFHWLLPQALLRWTIHWSYKQEGEFQSVDSKPSPPAFTASSEFDLEATTRALFVVGATIALIETRGRLDLITSNHLLPISITTLLLLADNRSIRRVWDCETDRSWAAKLLTIGSGLWLFVRLANLIVPLNNIAQRCTYWCKGLAG